MIIDFHTHTFPDAIAEKAINVIENKALTPAYRDGTVTSLLKSMADAGVTHSVCLAVATNPLKVPHINDVSIQSTNKNVYILLSGLFCHSLSSSRTQSVISDMVSCDISKP